MQSGFESMPLLCFPDENMSESGLFHSHSRPYQGLTSLRSEEFSVSGWSALTCPLSFHGMLGTGTLLGPDVDLWDHDCLPQILLDPRGSVCRWLLTALACEGQPSCMTAQRDGVCLMISKGEHTGAEEFSCMLVLLLHSSSGSGRFSPSDLHQCSPFSQTAPDKHTIEVSRHALVSLLKKLLP